MNENLSADEIWPTATMHVTFMDGHTMQFHNTRFLAQRGYSNPIVIDGTTLTFESRNGETATLLGVRMYELEH